MGNPMIYKDYEIQCEAFQHRVGKYRGCWGSSFCLAKVGALPSATVVAASHEKTAEAAIDKAQRRAMALVDERLSWRAGETMDITSK